ncbi:hypothetical protein N0V86_001269 [Didymella sp. IMI 355093]|nr:hypothetical protein N0V86_001269 [Didymella sp. IMI 355093]
MAVDNSLESLLATLTTSIQSATEALPQDGILPPKEGISLLDVKNELLLSYLQNLVFLILLKLRARSSGESDQLHPQDEVVQKLVELRIYLEKGVRPLENRLKYNIDKIIRSADDAARRTAQATAKPKPKKSRNDTGSGSDESDAESAASDQTADSEDEMAYAPNKAAVVRAEQEQPSARDRESAKDGIYRPPKITPMAMPTTEGRAERRDRRPNKSATLDEFIATELSSAPIAEPSIGSTITHGGRHTRSEKERREENERREYEEANFTRLAPKSKKEKRKEDRGRSQGGFGGEEWRGLGAGIDRIERLTQKKEGSGKGSLEKSRKRPVEDGPRGSGSAAGDAFAKRQKVVSSGTIYFAAHPADTLIYQNPDLFHDLYVYKCITTVVFTSGDRGIQGNFSRSLEHGLEAAYSWMNRLAVNNQTWPTNAIQIGDYNVTVSKPQGMDNMQIIYLRLPDGGPFGASYVHNKAESLKKLYSGEIKTVTTTDDRTTYTVESLSDIIAVILHKSDATDIRVLDYKTGIPNEEHERERDVVKQTNSTAKLRGYAGSFARRFNASLNKTDLDFKRKVAAFLTYAKYDLHMIRPSGSI